MLPDPPPSAGRRSERAPGRHRQSQDSNLLGVVTRTRLHGRAWAAAPSGCHQGGRQGRREGGAAVAAAGTCRGHRGSAPALALALAQRARQPCLASRCTLGDTSSAACVSVAQPACSNRAGRCNVLLRRLLPACCAMPSRAPSAVTRDPGRRKWVRWCGNLACVSDICPDDALLRLPSPLKYSSANAQPNLPGHSADSRTLTFRLTARPLLASR